MLGGDFPGTCFVKGRDYILECEQHRHETKWRQRPRSYLFVEDAKYSPAKAIGQLFATLAKVENARKSLKLDMVREVKRDSLMW